MENSPTDAAQVEAASSEELTVQDQGQVAAAEQTNQETNSGTTQESVSTNSGNAEGNQDDTAQSQKQTEEQGSASQVDDGLAKFAKSQGFDPEQLNEDTIRALKIAHDNQKAFRSRSQESITDATKGLAGKDIEARLAELEHERVTDRFFSEGRDRSLEPKMVQILNEKREQFGDTYAYNLSRDLDALYALAGGVEASTVDVEAIRREERESINKRMSASAPDQHATHNSMQTTQIKVTPEWLQTEYDVSNPEHQKLVSEYMSGVSNFETF